MGGKGLETSRERGHLDEIVSTFDFFCFPLSLAFFVFFLFHFRTRFYSSPLLYSVILFLLASFFNG